ncbi:hypothetical protein [Blastococcus sp. CT_GayMR16]|uniref:hypothetical protein n=1 Tax=Blastococcus sp. CT_GayMR16 TaxID=2559607 RepID=UPI0010740D58|nr:hypothetical protein [Blastococcus sp. CT_GayMR16]TFV90432.1 hypothetical protein E4P38_03060 [Blastococcus sp. CT_GayMR16]
MSGARRSAVKVRWMRGAVTGPWTVHETALKLLEDLEREVIGCADGYGFVTVEGFDGREVLVRGREVVTIECVRETPASVPPSSVVTRSGDGGTVLGPRHPGGYDPASAPQQVAAGTEFLRQQAAVRLAAESGQRVHQ